VLELQEQDGFDVFADIHEKQDKAAIAHDYSEKFTFFPWHRAFLWKFENALRGLGGRFKCVTIPFWDSENESEDDLSTSFLLDKSHFGRDTDDDGCLVDGHFTKRSFSISSGSTSDACLRRLVNKYMKLPEPAVIFGTITESTSLQNLSSGLWSPHGIAHSKFRKSQMSTMASPADPLFFLHHANVDRWFAVWQEYHGQRELEQADINVDIPLLMDGNGRFTDTTATDEVLTFKDGMSMDGKMSFRYANDDYSHLAVKTESKSSHQFKWVLTEWPPKTVPPSTCRNDASPTSLTELPVETYFQKLTSRGTKFIASGDADADVRSLALKSCEANKPTQREIEESPFLQRMGEDAFSCKRFEAPVDDAKLQLSGSTSLHSCGYGLHSIVVAAAVLLSELAI
jgi:tyrosinase